MGLLKGVEQAGDRIDGGRRGDEAKGMTGRRGVDDDFVVRSGARQLDELEQSGQFIDTGNREDQQRFDVASIEPGPALEDFGERGAMPRQPSCERPFRIELDAIKARCNPADTPRKPAIEGIAQRMGRIGRDNEDAPAGVGVSERARRRAGRFADAALAPVKDETRNGRYRRSSS
jgi:hypothetical protein